MFNLLRRKQPVHLKRAEVLLREAHLARMEHQAAAEHHAALAEMYAQRAARLERELQAVHSGSWHELDPVGPQAPVEPSMAPNVHPVPFAKPERLERR